MNTIGRHSIRIGSVSFFKLPENAPAGHVIGQLSAIDPDIATPNQTLSYSIVTDPHNLFTLDGDKLIVGIEADF